MSRIRPQGGFLIPHSRVWGEILVQQHFSCLQVFCCSSLCHGQRRLKVSSTHFGWLRYCFDFTLNFLKKKVNVVQKFQLKSSIIIPSWHIHEENIWFVCKKNTFDRFEHHSQEMFPKDSPCTNQKQPTEPPKGHSRRKIKVIKKKVCC